MTCSCRYPGLRNVRERCHRPRLWCNRWILRSCHCIWRSGRALRAVLWFVRGQKVPARFLRQLGSMLSGSTPLCALRAARFCRDAAGRFAWKTRWRLVVLRRSSKMGPERGSHGGGLLRNVKGIKSLMRAPVGLAIVAVIRGRVYGDGRRLKMIASDSRPGTRVVVSVQRVTQRNRENARGRARGRRIEWRPLCFDGMRCRVSRKRYVKPHAPPPICRRYRNAVSCRGRCRLLAGRGATAKGARCDVYARDWRGSMQACVRDAWKSCAAARVTLLLVWGRERVRSTMESHG